MCRLLFHTYTAAALRRLPRVIVASFSWPQSLAMRDLLTVNPTLDTLVCPLVLRLRRLSSTIFIDFS
jgi:hypothetical protein